MKHTALAVLVAALIVLGVAFVDNDFYLRIVFMVGVYYLAAAGMNVLLGYAGQKSLGQAGLFAAGAYGAALLTARYGLDPWVALVISVILAAAAGVVIAVPSLRVKGPSLAMVTLAFGIVAQTLASQNVDFFGGSAGIIGVQPLYIGGKPFDLHDWVWFVVILSLGVHLLLRNLLLGRFGRAFVSLRLDETAASSVGVSVYGYKVLAFVIAAATCGLAGALVAQQNEYFNSDFIDFNLSIFIFLLVMLGGSGSIYGPLFGAAVLTVLQAYVARWPWVENFINGGILLFALFVFPDGLAGLFRRVFARRGAARPAAVAEGALIELGRRAPVPAGQPVLAIEGLSKAYGGIRPARDVDFNLEAGEIHALIGPNGAGKTTVLNMLTGLVRPDAGVVRFLGRDISGWPAHRICKLGMARTFQNLRLFDELSVLENVLMGQHSRLHSNLLAGMLALPSARQGELDALRKARQVLAFVGLEADENVRAGSLAYGLQRRVELARALATEPTLLLLDEPAAGLNPGEARELGQLLLRIRAQGISILLVEHHMEIVMEISDRVTVLDYGVRIAEGAPLEVRHDPRVVEAYFGTPPRPTVTPAGGAAARPAAAGGAVRLAGAAGTLQP